MAGLRIFWAQVVLMLKTAEDHIQEFNPAELGAIAHLYRGEIYRSTIWRTRLDNTTNWSIVTMGIALSTTFSSKEASALPLILIGMLLAVFLGLEARRYRFFNVWRARARFMKTHFYAIHPEMASHVYEFVDRAKIGPIPGWVVLICGLLYNLCWIVLAVGTYWADRRAHKNRTSSAAMG